METTRGLLFRDLTSNRACTFCVMAMRAESPAFLSIFNWSQGISTMHIRILKGKNESYLCEMRRPTLQIILCLSYGSLHVELYTHS